MEHGYSENQASSGTLGGAATGKRETLSDRLSSLTDNLESVANSLDYTVDRLLGRPSSDSAGKAISGATCLAATAERLAAQIERISKMNEQISEVA